MKSRVKQLLSNLPLRQKFFLPMVASLAVIFTVATIYYPTRHKRALRDAFAHAATKTAELLAVALTNAIDQHNFQLLQSILEGADVDKNISLILVYDRQGELISAYNPRHILLRGVERLDQLDLRSVADASLIIRQAIRNNEEERLADMVFVYSLEELNRQALEYRMVTFAITFVAFALGILLIDKISRDVTGSLAHLHEQMKEIIEKKNFGRQVQVRTRDEVGNLAAAFNEMMRELQSRHDRLVESQRKYQALYEKYRRLNRLKSEFVSDASHHLRTPLTILKGEIEVALRRERSPEDYRRTLQVILSETEHLIAIVENLLTLAQAETDDLLLLENKVNVTELCRKQIRKVQPLLEQKHLHLIERLENGCTLQGDPNRLSEVMFNLLENAVKYSPEGRNIEVELSENGDSVVFRVSDEGIGIPDREREKIFERFFRGGNVPGAVKGSGLGLATCKSIVEAHGGRITVESEEGRGSVFTVILPKSPRRPEE